MESGKLFIQITQKENNFPNNHPLGSHNFLQTISYRNNGNIKVKIPVQMLSSLHGRHLAFPLLLFAVKVDMKMKGTVKQMLYLLEDVNQT